MSNNYRFVYKDARRQKFKGTSDESIFAGQAGAILTQDLPLTTSISVDFFPNPGDTVTSTYHDADLLKLKLRALEPISKKYIKYSHFFNFNTIKTECDTLGLDFYNTNITMVSIPSIFYGESLEKGSVKLTTYTDGAIASVIQDINKNGELLSVEGNALQAGEGVAGLVYYDEGIILLFDDTPLASYKENFYKVPNFPATPDYPTWYNWGSSFFTEKQSVVKTSYDLEFNGVNSIPQVTMLASARAGQLNYSNNKTFLKKHDNYDNIYNVDEKIYFENANQEIKNITKTQYVSPVPVFEKETYITKILIYDEEMNVLAEAKLAKPVRKTEGRELLFKLKLDL